MQLQNRNMVQLHARLSASYDELMCARVEMETFRNKFVGIRCAVSSPTNKSLLKSRSRRHDVPTHVGIHRFSINVYIKRISRKSWRIYQRLNHVVPRIRICNREAVSSATAVGHTAQHVLGNIAARNSEWGRQYARLSFERKVLSNQWSCFYAQR